MHPTMKLYQQPLLHFLAAGTLLFILFNAVADSDQDQQRIVVDRDTLLQYLQYQTKNFNAQKASQELDSLDQQQLQRLVDRYVEEESLYREAMAMGLDNNDYVIKKRIIQKIEFIHQAAAESAAAATSAELESYYQKHSARYYREPKITFTHVFFSDKLHGKSQARLLAQQQLAELNRDRVPFSQAIDYGDRFLYHLNYVERTPDFVASHFGQAMARSVFALDPRTPEWHGPFASGYGQHLVLVSRQQAGGITPFEEMESQVRADLNRDRLRDQLQSAADQVADQYRIAIAGDLRERLEQ
jgi:hypothetical protein